jgi:periplasmic protein TonB
MDLQRELLESQKRKGSGRTSKASAASLAAHGVLIAAIVFAGSQTSHKVNADDTKIPTFISQGAAPPPPPPPPPPKAAANTPRQQPRVVPKVQQPQPTFTQPTEIPKEVPKVDPIPTTNAVVDLTPSESSLPESGADVGGVAGGVPGGVVGGQVGGVIGGEVGGEVGGVVGGKLGGEVGGTGTGTEGTGTGGPEAPVVPQAPPPPPPPAPEPEPEPPSGPLRVGGDVKAPVIAHRADPEYTEIARQARVSGVVVVEAIIDKHGNVDSVKVVKGLPMGLSEAAVRAVRQWKFKPGTLNGAPVDTIFNLTVNFKLN